MLLIRKVKDKVKSQRNIIVNQPNIIIIVLIMVLKIISISAELNRTPSDLPECESELVAGFITEYSPIYFSSISSTEYANIIALIVFIIILFPLIYNLNIILLLLISLIRSTLNRLKFDELMTNCRIIIINTIDVVNMPK